MLLADLIKIVSPSHSKYCDSCGLEGKLKKKNNNNPKTFLLNHEKFLFPSVLPVNQETGEVKSLVLCCGSCIKDTGSSFPGVREPREVGRLSNFQVKMIKAMCTLHTIAIQPKHSIKHSEMHFPGRQ